MAESTLIPVTVEENGTAYEYTDSFDSIHLFKGMIDAIQPRLATYNSAGDGVIYTTLTAPIKRLALTYQPNQDGTGTPSINNVRNFIGTTGVAVLINSDEEASITFPQSVGTLYGGIIDATNGILYRTHVYVRIPWGSMANATVYSEYTRKRVKIGGSGEFVVNITNDPWGQLCNVAPYGNSGAADTHHFYVSADGYAYLYMANDTPGSTVVEICVRLNTPTPYNIDSVNININKGTNTIQVTPYSDKWTTEAEYWTHTTAVPL